MSTTSQSNALRAVKLVHTAVWAFFAFCILAIPAFAWRANYGYASLLIGIVFIFGLLYVVAILFTLVRWAGAPH